METLEKNKTENGLQLSPAIAPPADEYLKSDEAKAIVKKAKEMFKQIEAFVNEEINKL